MACLSQGTLTFLSVIQSFPVANGSTIPYLKDHHEGFNMIPNTQIVISEKALIFLDYTTQKIPLVYDAKSAPVKPQLQK